MEENKQKDNKQAENLSASDKKRTFLNISVSPNEKLQVTKEAVSGCGISVSEYCRTKIFTPKPEQNIEQVIDFVSDPEREVYENKIKELKETNSLLNEELIKIKVGKSLPGQSDEFKILEDENISLKEELEKLKVSTLVGESDIYLPLTPDERKIIDLAIHHEKISRFWGDTHKDSLAYVSKSLEKIVTDNKAYYPKEYKKLGTPEYIVLDGLLKRLKSVQVEQPEKEVEKPID